MTMSYDSSTVVQYSSTVVILRCEMRYLFRIQTASLDSILAYGSTQNSHAPDWQTSTLSLFHTSTRPLATHPMHQNPESRIQNPESRIQMQRFFCAAKPSERDSHWSQSRTQMACHRPPPIIGLGPLFFVLFTEAESFLIE